MNNSIRILVIILAAWVILLIPFRIIGLGFLPCDDALRHSAKVVSEKDWSQILVLRNEIKMDSYPGWHSILGLVRKITGWDAHSLVLFSVVFLFVLFCSAPLGFLRYPETWLISLCAVTIVSPEWFFRILLGRPYIYTMFCLLLILFIWPGLKSKKMVYARAAAITLIITSLIFVHGSWYLIPLLLAVFLIAREWRVALILAACSLAGIMLGASFTGHPVIFMKQMVTHLLLVFGNHGVQSQLVTELRPSGGDFRILTIIAFMLIWRRLSGKQMRQAVDNPDFILAAACFLFMTVSKRAWLDWGIPAMCVWMARQFEELFGNWIDRLSWRRIILVLLSGSILYLFVTSDIQDRWSNNRPRDYLSQDDPEQAGWVPDKGGIIYSNDMGVFFQTFYKNPKAPWRYMLGFESTFMPQEDVLILRDIQKNRGLYNYYEPWVKKMRPEDRLVVRGVPEFKPKIPGLEWNYAAIGLWVGRTPRDAKR